MTTTEKRLSLDDRADRHFAEDRIHAGREGAERRLIMRNAATAAIARSAPAQLRELAIAARVPVYGDPSDELKAACAAHNAMVTKMLADLDSGLAALQAALDMAAEAGTYGDVFAAVENLKFDHQGMAQQVVAIYSNALELVTRMEAELRPIGPKLDADAQAIIEAVKADLTKIGSGVETFQAYGKNSAAADRQFHCLAMQNARASKATLAALVAKNNHSAAAERRGIVLRGQQRAEDYLHQVVLKAING